ncbi:ThuA domain-containing protein [Bacteroidota bacterium]
MKKLYQFIFLSFIGIMSLVSQPDSSEISILVLTKTTDYKHEVLPIAIKTLVELGDSNNWNLTITEDTRLFTPTILLRYDVVIFLMTIGNLFNEQQRMAFMEFIKSGKGFVGIHTATITETNWPWYEELIGTFFIGHPPEQQAKLIIEDKSHPATSFFSENEWICTDEWYNFISSPHNKVNVLISIDEDSYDVDNNEWFPGIEQRMGDHPLVWYSEYEGSRIFQTGLGHTLEMYNDKLFKKHLAGAINWAAFRE